MIEVGRWDGEGMVSSGPPELFKLFHPRTGSTASIRGLIRNAMA